MTRLLPFDHLFDPLAVIAAAGIFHAIGRDDKERVLGDILGSCVLVDVADVVDRAADGIEQRRAAAHIVIPLRHRCDVLYRYAVVDDNALIVEEHCRDQRLAGLIFLLCDHGVEPADGIRLQAGHRAAAVKDEYNLRQVLFHAAYLRIKNMTVWLCLTVISYDSMRFVRSHGRRHFPDTLRHAPIRL